MITKVVFTMLVIVIVGILFSKQRTSSSSSAKTTPSGASTSSLSPAHLAYGLVALLIIVAGVIAYFNRSEANKIIILNVYGAAGAHTQYQARQKNINGRSFITLDNRQVQLAETDRLEIVNP